MKYAKSFRETADGHEVVNKRLHGFKWKKEYEVTFYFDTEQERDELIKLLETIEKFEQDNTNGCASNKDSRD